MESLQQHVALGSLEGDLPHGATEESWEDFPGEVEIMGRPKGTNYHGVWGKVGDHPDRENSMCEALRQERGWHVWNR